MLPFHQSALRIPFTLLPVCCLAAQSAAVSPRKTAAKVNLGVKTTSFSLEWDSLFPQTFVILAFLDLLPYFRSVILAPFAICALFLFLSLGPFKDCLQALEDGHTASGMYLVKPENANRLMQVWCDQRHDPGGWTVIQRRVDGSVNFFRNWETYKV